MQQIRNIKSIQVFEAVARVKNVTNVARLLNTSQSSVSYHIKKLEADLRVALFKRTPTGLELTEDGAVLARHVERGLATIQTGLEKVVRKTDSVKVALLSMFATRWLSSRLGDLRDTHPGLQLTVQNHNNTYAKLDQPESFADLGIQWGRGDWKNFDVRRLWSEKLVVVCSPQFRVEHPIATPSDLENCTLLHVDDERMWAEWFSNNGLALSSSQPQMMLEDRHFQLSSTMNGLGVSLFTSWLVESELQSGTLINPFARHFDTSFAYHLMVPKDSQLSQAAIDFKGWLLGCCDQHEDNLAKQTPPKIDVT